MTLKEYIESIASGKVKSIKKKIVEKCGISEDVLWNWIDGRTNVPYLSQKVINGIAKRVLTYSINKKTKVKN